jgi:hypothetical protein
MDSAMEIPGYKEMIEYLAMKIELLETKARLAEVERELKRLRACVKCEKIPEGYDVNDDATTELAVSLTYAQHDLEAAEQEREELIELVRQFNYYIHTTHLDMGGKHRYQLKANEKAYRLWEKLREAALREAAGEN